MTPKINIVDLNIKPTTIKKEPLKNIFALFG